MLDKTARDIELDKILDDVRRHALSPEGKAAITPALFTSDRAAVERRAERIGDYKERLASSRPELFPPIQDVLDYASSTHQDFPGFMTRRAGEFLSSYFSMLAFSGEEDRIREEDRALSDEILEALDGDGEVLETHPRLRVLFRELEKRKKERTDLSNAFMARNRSLVMQSEPLFRNNRVVIPVRSDAKLPPSCYVSGMSGSGATLLAEPRELLESNNSVVIAEERIRAEKERIKHELALRVREEVPQLRKMLKEVISFDFHYSFAVWARDKKAARAQKGSSVKLLEARHPLLGAKAVPVSIAVPEGVKAVVFSGANAGGKTVTMKIIALFSALNQISGYIPASSLSELPFFDAIYTDIGDGQSILEDVSTFSSHMGNIAQITRKAGERSLVVLDELGSGTDPEEGAALSEAVLTYFSSRVALTCVTSHYSTVKSLAYSSEVMMNASMEFDERSGLPTYRVIEGIPGDSHAIATAKRMGLPKEIISQADTALKGGSASSASVINALLKKEKALDRKVSQLENLRREEERKSAEAEERLQALERKEDELRREGIKDINDYLSKSRKELEGLIADLRTGKLTPEKTKKAKAFMDSVDRKSAEEKAKLKAEEADNTPFDIGDYVLCGSGRSPGEVQSVEGNNIRVILENGLRLTLKKSQVRHSARPEARKIVSYSTSKRAESTIDVRGLTLAEATARLDDQIEAALLSGLSSFSVIHGFGDGILSRGIHNYLKKRREVEDYAFALPEDGGMGKTYVTLRKD